jgi:uncharacterized membrane protein
VYGFKEALTALTEQAIIIVDAFAMAIILFGTVQAALGILTAYPDTHRTREVWLRYARWLVGGLTFQLAADIIETSITTQWDAVGRLAAIAVIRTFLNYFLERDLAEIRSRQTAVPGMDEEAPQIR